MNRCAKMIVALTVAVCVGGAAVAAIITEETFDGGVAGFGFVAPESGFSSAPTTATGIGGKEATDAALFLNVTVPNLPPPNDLLTVTTGPLTGNFTDPKANNFSFDFYFDTAAFAGGTGLQLYFESSSSTAEWIYNIDVGSQTPGTWATYGVGFSLQGSWFDQTFTSPGSFLTDISNITDIGFRLTYVSNASNQQYAFDNVRRGYATPEPSEFLMLGFSLVGLCLAFRRQLNGLSLASILPKA